MLFLNISEKRSASVNVIKLMTLVARCNIDSYYHLLILIHLCNICSCKLRLICSDPKHGMNTVVTKI